MGRGNTLIVDDEADIRLLLFVTINNANRGLRVVGEASSGDQALKMHADLDVDVVVLDQRMRGLSGLETAKALLAEREDLPIVLYSAYLNDVMAEEARQVGVRRCIRKGDEASLITALHELTGTGSDDWSS